MQTEKIHDVIIIGAGAAGVGLGVLFEKMGFENYLILEKDTVGSSFKQWLPYTHFISPSFSGNSFGAPDLNAVTPDTSPAFTLKTEHPSGAQYAQYLEVIARHFEVKVAEGVEVTSIEKEDEVFTIQTNTETFQARNIVWAGGEFQYPATSDIPGAEHCTHSSQLTTIEGDEVTIIGGYESGADLAVEALRQGKKVIIIDEEEPWELTVSDSSISLSVYTQDRLRPYMNSGQLTFIGNAQVTEIKKEGDEYVIELDGSGSITVADAPVLATGFTNLPKVIAPYFTETQIGSVALTENDESTTTPGCFLIGPKVRHGDAIFCFIYKFRQRFPIVAETIVKRVGSKTEIPEEYFEAGMYLRDAEGCGDECAC